MSKPPVEDNSLLAVVSEWLGLFKSIPGAGKAIARLVGAFGDAGAKVEQSIGEAGAAGMDIATAKAEDAAARIRGETKAREKVRAAMASAAVKQIEATPEMGERALAYWADDLVTKQSNREAVALRALEHLNEDPPLGQKQEPEDDWLNIFSSHAERASSEFMREHWARVLSGEIRRPGSFSYSTLQLISIIDPKLADLIIEVSGWIVDGRTLFTTGYFKEGEGYTKLLRLQSIGFIAVGHGMFSIPGANGLVSVVTPQHRLTGQFTSGIRFTLPAAFLTLAGEELYTIIDKRESTGLIPAVEQMFRENGATEFSAAIIP